MTVKKVAIIAAAGAVLLAGALTLSMTLITRNKIEVTATETSAQNETEQEEGGVKTLENMENMPLYFEDTEKLLLPLRNTMEALGGTVKWDTETKQTAISYRGRTLRVRSGERDAVLNGYAVTLPDEPNMINGCLPDSYEIVGFDNSPIANEAIIPITTIGQQIDVIARTAMDLLVKQMDNRKQRKPEPDLAPTHKKITPVLIRRETTS